MLHSHEEVRALAIPDRFLRRVHTIEPTANARAAATAMREHGVGALVLTDERGAPAALVTDRDVALTVLRDALDPDDTPVAECVQRDLVTLDAGASLADAVQLMRRKLVRRLPIVGAGGELVGMLSADDLLRSFGEELRWVAEAVQQGFRNEAHPPPTSAPILGKE